MMAEGYAELLALIGKIGSRWRAVTTLRVWTRAAGAAGSTAGALPFTGSESLIVALFGLMALGLGTGLRRAVRQKA